MAAEGGYAASGQFKSIADNAASAVLSVQQLAKDFVALSSAVAGISVAVKEFGQLQQTLVLTNTVAQGNAQQLQAMNDAVRNMALNYKFSANEGAQALYFLSSAGFSVGESLRAMSGVTLLAQGTLSDLAQVADTVANTISAFGLQAGDSTRIANLFAAAISVTQATMDKLSYSMRYVAPVAASMGASVEQTTVALSLLYNAGNRGQQAGTLLRDILVRLVNPSKEAGEVLSQLGISILDDTGKTRNFVDILKEMSSLNLSPITLSKIFEQRGISGAQTLLASFDPGVFAKRLQDSDFAAQVDNIAKRAGVAATSITNMYELMNKAETGTTFATKLAIEQNNTLAGSFAKAKNALVEVGLTLGEQLAPGIQSIANEVTDLVKSFRSLDDGTKKVLTDLPLLAIVGIGIGKAFGGIQSSVLGTLGAFAQWRTAINEVRTAQDTLRSALDATNTLVNRQNGLLVQAFARPQGGVGYRYQAGQGQGGFVGAGNVITQAQYAESEYQNARQAYARSLTTNRPLPVPIAPENITTARATAASAAAGAAAAALAGVSAIVTGVLAVVSIAALAAAAWPFIKDYINSKPGHSDIGAPQEDTSVNDVAAILSTPSGSLEKLTQLQGLQEQRQGSLDFFNQVLKDRQDQQDKAKAELTEYVAKQLELNGQIDKANQVRKTGDISFVRLVNSNPDEFGSTSPEQLAGQVIAQSADFKAIQKKADDARAAADSASTSITNLTTSVKYIGGKIDELKDAPSTKLALEQKNALDLTDYKQGGDQLIVVLTEWLTSLEKQGREAQIAAAKAAATITQNPIDGYVAAIVENQLSLIDKLRSAQDKLKSEFDKNLGTIASNTFTPAIKEQLAKMLTGMSWTETIHDAFADSAVTVQHAGIAEMIAKGMSPDAAFAEYKKGFDQATADLSQGNPAVKDALNRFNATAIQTLQAPINEARAAAIKAMFDALTKAQANRQFENSLRDQLIQYNNSFLQAIDTATNGEIPTVKLNIDLNNLNKQFNDQIEKIKQEHLTTLKKLGAENANLTPDQLAQYDAQSRAEVQPLIDAENKAYAQQVQNVINAAKQAQIKAEVDIKNALDDAKVLQSQINRDLGGLYASMGLQIPRSVFQQGAALEFEQENAKIDQTIGNLKLKIEQLKQYQATLNDLQAHPEKLAAGAQIPALPKELTGSPAEQMRQALQQGTEQFQEKLGSNLRIFTNEFNAVLQSFLRVFDSSLHGVPNVQVPAPAVPYTGITGSGSSAVKGYTSGGLPVYITNGTNTQPALPNPQALNFAGTQTFGSNALTDAVAKLESNNSPIDGPSGRYANYRYQQFNGFVDQYGAGASGVNNYAQQVLKANPNATFGDFYGGYVTGTGNPATANMNSLLTTTQPGAQGAYGNLVRNSPIAPDTPLSSVLGQSTQPQMTPDQVQQTTAFWQTQANIITGIDGDIAKMASLQDQVTTAASATNAQIKAGQEDVTQRLSIAQQTLDTAQKMKDANDAKNSAPDAAAIAAWNNYSAAVNTAAKDLGGSQDMMRGVQVANAQMVVQLGNDAKLAAQTYQTAANSIATNLTGLITGNVKDWHTALKNIANDIATTILKALILRALTGLGGSLFGGIATPATAVASAKGNAFDSSGMISYFANGDIFDQPTGFNYGPGGKKRGVMGEAGPEAAMPLVRTPDGKLAVRALSTPLTPIVGGSDRGGSQGGINYSPNFHFYGDNGSSGQTPTGSDRQQRNRMVSMQKELDREMEATFVRVANKYQRSGGFLNPSGQRLGIAGPQ